MSAFEFFMTQLNSYFSPNILRTPFIILTKYLHFFLRAKPPLTRGMTLTLLTLSNVNDTIDEAKEEITNISNGGITNIGGSQNPLVNQNHHDSQQSKLPISISLPDRIKLWFKARPIFNLICIIIFNGLLSAACSALVIRIEKPSQDIRLAQRTELLSKLEKMKINITSR